MKLEDLKTPFPATDIEWRVGSVTKDGKKGTALAYLTNRAIMDRLDEVAKPENWRNEFIPWKGGQLCGISINIESQWITKWDGADDSKIEPLKGGLSDSMKRAAVQWGIGRYLYNLDSQWIELDEYKRLLRIPTLPKWALPGFTGVIPAKVETPANEPAPNPDGTITKEQKDTLWNLTLKLQGNKEFAVDCIKELTAKQKVKKMEELKNYDECYKFITEFDKDKLPFALAPEGE